VRYRSVTDMLPSLYFKDLSSNRRSNGRKWGILEDSAGEARRKPLAGINHLMRRILIDERYDLRHLVGSGGMADVYLAHDEVLDRDVALKLLKIQYAKDEEFVERFRREARSAAALANPHIVPIFDRGETENGTYYIAMEYLPGGTLKDRIRSSGALPPHTAAEVALQTVEALQAAHEKGIIHRDVKPDNILLTGPGYAKVADFGIARAADATTISHSGDILGSAKYMPPEQAGGGEVGPASDLYSLGVVLYEMLTGRTPFEVDTLADLSAKHYEKPPHPSEVNPEVQESLDAIVMRLLARVPEDRYGSAAELVEVLRRVREGLPPVASSEDVATTTAMSTAAAPTLQVRASDGTEPRGRRWLLLLMAVTLIGVLSVVGGAVGWNLWRDASKGDVPSDAQVVPQEEHGGAHRQPPAPEEAKVPGVVGLTEQEARERLAEVGFGVEVKHRESSEEDADKVLEQSIPGGKNAKADSDILLTVAKAPEPAKVPNLVGLSYPEAEDRLEEAGFLLGGVKEAPSDIVAAGVIIEQDPLPGTEQDPNSYVYLTTSVGPSEESGAGGGQGPGAGVTGHEASGEVSSEQEAVAAAVRGHYGAIGAGDFEEAYSYFGPTFRSQHSQADWIAGEQPYQIQSTTINSLQVNEVAGDRATATVDVTVLDNTGTPRFLITWNLVKDGGEWRLDYQLSARRID
jgi:eukaryotic-like serine/threonine-protein kinase